MARRVRAVRRNLRVRALNDGAADGARIWVDADACPRAAREILVRAAERCAVELVLVSNQAVPTPPSRYVRKVRVGAGFDAADHHIADAVAAGDLVVTADVPLAAAAVERGATALDPRGRVVTADNVAERLAVRDMMEELRTQRAISGGPPPLGARDKQQFANQLDRWLARRR